MTEQDYNYLLSRMESIGPVNYDRLMALYGSAEMLWKCSNPMLTSARQRREWYRFHDKEEELHLLYQKERMQQMGIRYLDRQDPEYPQELLYLADPPIGIFVRGRLPAATDPKAAIIGSRQFTPYGKSCAMQLAEGLAKRGVWVISGMALGIDAWSQRSALKHGGGSLGILGSGIDVCYPTENEDLYRELIHQGGIMSEYGPGEPGLPFHFPLRNRLIAAMSQVIVVVEARRKSGTLITVDQGLEQGKSILAVPGRIDDPMSAGCHDLLRQGAGVCTDVEDVLHELGMDDISGTEEKDRRKQSLSSQEKRVLEELTCDPLHLDELMARTKMPASEILMVLWQLERKNLCMQASSNTYQIV